MTILLCSVQLCLTYAQISLVTYCTLSLTDCTVTLCLHNQAAASAAAAAVAQAKMELQLEREAAQESAAMAQQWRKIRDTAAAEAATLRTDMASKEQQQSALSSQRGRTAADITALTQQLRAIDSSAGGSSSGATQQQQGQQRLAALTAAVSTAERELVEAEALCTPAAAQSTAAQTERTALTQRSQRVAQDIEAALREAQAPAAVAAAVAAGGSSSQQSLQQLSAAADSLAAERRSAAATAIEMLQKQERLKREATQLRQALGAAPWAAELGQV
jgi:chromosome segregation ATPase